MGTCLARQPIFDAKMNVYGYELLYRASETSVGYDGSDPDKASSEMIMLSMDIGARKLTGNRLAFINFTQKLLVNEIATILPRNRLVIEILESVQPADEVMSACRKLKKQGYLLALDDYLYTEETRELLDVADIVKIDFIKCGGLDSVRDEVQKIQRYLRRISRVNKVRLLAEKLETAGEYVSAHEMGFSLYQGYFFSRPELMSKKKMAPLRINQLRLIRETMNPMVDYRRLAGTISNDPVLSYRILRLVNSTYYGLQYEIKSINHALAILGIENIRKYVTLLAIEQVRDEKPEELFRMSLIRGHFLESIAPLAGMRKMRDDLFLLGIFSCMDVMTDMSMEEIVELTRLSNSVAEPLITGRGKSADLLSIIINYERGNWDDASATAAEYDISSREMLKFYLDAVEWADDMF